MSDERPRTALTLLMQDVGWAEGPFYIDNEKVGRILAEQAESQNQALQEALKELVEEMKHLVNHGGVGTHQAVFDKARNALSPTQETDR